MNVSELIEALKAMPQDASVKHLWDGETRTEIHHVWLARSGAVVTADNSMSCYSTEDRPESAPTREQQSVWISP